MEYFGVTRDADFSQKPPNLNYSIAILGIFEQSLATSRSSTRIRHSEPLAKTCHPKDGSKNLPVPVPILDFHNHFDSS